MKKSHNTLWLEHGEGRREWKKKDNFSIIARQISPDSNVFFLDADSDYNYMGEISFEEFEKELNQWYPVNSKIYSKKKFITLDTFSKTNYSRPLEVVVDEINNKSISCAQQDYLCSFIVDFQSVLKHIKSIETDSQFRLYIIELVSNDYVEKLRCFEQKFGKTIFTHLNNYIQTELKKERIKVFDIRKKEKHSQ